MYHKWYSCFDFLLSTSINLNRSSACRPQGSRRQGRTCLPAQWCDLPRLQLQLFGIVCHCPWPQTQRARALHMTLLPLPKPVQGCSHKTFAMFPGCAQLSRALQTGPIPFNGRAWKRGTMERAEEQNGERTVLVFTSDFPWMPQISTQKF